MDHSQYLGYGELLRGMMQPKKGRAWQGKTNLWILGRKLELPFHILSPFSVKHEASSSVRSKNRGALGERFKGETNYDKVASKSTSWPLYHLVVLSWS